MTTITIIAVIVLVVVVACVTLGLFVRTLAREVKRLRDAHRRIVNDYVRVAEGRAEIRREINSLADVVAANARRLDREVACQSHPSLPACPETYISRTYPKRADEV